MFQQALLCACHDKIFTIMLLFSFLEKFKQEFLYSKLFSCLDRKYAQKLSLISFMLKQVLGSLQAQKDDDMTEQDSLKGK